MKKLSAVEQLVSATGFSGIAGEDIFFRRRPLYFMDISGESFRPTRFVCWLAWFWVRLVGVNEQKYKDAGWNSYAEKLQFKFFKFYLSSRLYRVIEDERLARISARNFKHFCENGKISQIELPPGRELTFKHSGTGGDIIYALPAIKALSEGRPVKLFLNPPGRQIDEPFKPEPSHPFNLQMCQMLISLLEHQPWLASVQIYNGEPVDYDLDVFRRIPNIKTGQHSIAHWYFWIFAVSADLSRPWLEVRPAPVSSQRIVLARSARCRNCNLDYAFLREFGGIDFVGTAAEFEEMKQVLPELRHAVCEDFLQLAQTIRSARFFIGNQSLPFAIAEAMKVPRILEVCPRLPDVIPTGADTGEAFFQPNFEKLVKSFWEKPRT